MKWFKVRNVSTSTFEAPRHEVFSVSSSWVMSDDQWTFVAKRHVIFTYRFLFWKHLYCSFGQDRGAPFGLPDCHAAKQRRKKSFREEEPCNSWESIKKGWSRGSFNFIHCPFIRLEFQCWLICKNISCRFPHPDRQMSRRRLEHVVRSGPVHKLSFFAPCITPKRRSCVAAHFRSNKTSHFAFWHPPCSHKAIWPGKEMRKFE